MLNEYKYLKKKYLEKNLLRKISLQLMIKLEIRILTISTLRAIYWHGAYRICAVLKLKNVFVKICIQIFLRTILLRFTSIEKIELFLVIDLFLSIQFLLIIVYTYFLKNNIFSLVASYCDKYFYISRW